MTSSILEEDLIIEGNIKSEQGDVQVKGKVLGDVVARSIVVLTSGSIQGAVAASTVKVQGKLDGSIKCNDLVLAATSDVSADVVAQSATTESGARIVGKLQITGKPR